MGLFGRIKGAMLWEKALSFAASAQYAESLTALNEAATYLPEGIEQLLLRGHVLGGLGKYTECISIMEEAVERISLSHRGELERRYLKYFAQWRISEALTLIGKFSENGKINYIDVDLEKVPSHIKRKFPLRNHPSWKE